MAYVAYHFSQQYDIAVPLICSFHGVIPFCHYPICTIYPFYKITVRGVAQWVSRRLSCGGPLLESCGGLTRVTQCMYERRRDCQL